MAGQTRQDWDPREGSQGERPCGSDHEAEGPGVVLSRSPKDLPRGHTRSRASQSGTPIDGKGPRDWKMTRLEG